MMYFNYTFITKIFVSLMRPSSGWNYYKNTSLQYDGCVVTPWQLKDYYNCRSADGDDNNIFWS